MIKHICKICKNEYYIKQYRDKISKYCSKNCKDTSQKGKPLSKEHRRKIGEAHKGEKNHQWTGGQRKTDKGYITIYKPDHPYCYKNKCVKRANLVMEKYIGRYIVPPELVHHKNNIPDDDRLKNLKLCANNKEHRKIHRLIK